MVYYTQETADGQHQPGGISCTDLLVALSTAETFRQRGFLFVTMVSENANSVGKQGVDTVADGKLPNGAVYDWNKNSRIGATKRRWPFE